MPLFSCPHPLEHPVDSLPLFSQFRIGRHRVEVGLEVPVGETFKVAISCGAAVSNLHGFYKYELM